MGSKSSAPKVSSSQKKSEKLQMQLLKAQLKAARQPIHVPEVAVPDPVAPAPPPPSPTGADVLQAGQAARVNAGRRTGFGRTLFAGANPGALGGQKTLLG